VFQPRERGRTRQVVLRVQGASLDPEFEHGVMAETIGVIGVRVTRGDLINALSQKVPQGMVNIGLMALVVDSGREALGQPNLTVNTPEQEGPKVGGQGASLESGPDGLAGDRRKTQLFWATIGHKQTSCRLYGMDWTRILFYQRLTRGLSIFMKNSG
jgi:hypothetical protein